MGYKGKMASHMKFVVFGRQNGVSVPLERLSTAVSTYSGHEDFVRLLKEMTWKDFTRVEKAFMLDYSKGQTIASYVAAGREVSFTPENPGMLKELTEYLERPF